MGHTYEFPAGFTLEGDTEVTLRTRTGTGEDSDSELYWGETQAVWNNTGDTVFIYPEDDELVLEESY